VQSNRPNQEMRFGQSTVFVLMVAMTFCLTTLAATAQDMQEHQAAAAVRPAVMQESSGAPAASMQQAPPAAPSEPSMSDSGLEKVHIVVGHSLLIRTGSRVKRILTGNPAIIESVVTSPAELVVTAKEAGSSSLMLWDEKGQHRTLDVFADLDVSSLRNSLDQSFPRSNVDVQSEAGRIILIGWVPNPSIADQMLKMAGSYSKDVVNGLSIAPPLLHPKQIMLKVRFAEADRSKLTEFGFNLFSTGATNTIGAVSTGQFGPIATATAGGSGGNVFNLSSLLNIFLFRPDINLGATIQALQQKNVLQILAEPDLMAISGVPAHFLAGGLFPYPVVQGGASGTVPTVTIQFQPYGVKLEFTGIVNDDGTIRLKVAPEVSTLDYSNAIVISGFTLPAIQTRKAETEVELKDGQSFGIAGLLDQRATIQLSKIPGIGDIPILGQLFTSRSTNLTNTELVVLITPTIVDPVGGPALPPTQEVTFPSKNLPVAEFDKTVPDKAKTPEVIK
jgi:pilus assembly protein CpaC